MSNSDKSIKDENQKSKYFLTENEEFFKSREEFFETLAKAG